ncbi:MAG: hypothetical protein ACRDQU_17845 [Pseudonocardiaceae bacterium]
MTGAGQASQNPTFKGAVDDGTDKHGAHAVYRYPSIRGPLPGRKLSNRPALGRGEDSEDLIFHPADIAATKYIGVGGLHRGGY